MPIKPYQQSDIKYHQIYDRGLQCWCDVLDSDGNKVRSNTCLCKADSTDGCKCGAWNDWYDNFYEIEEIY